MPHPDAVEADRYYVPIFELSLIDILPTSLPMELPKGVVSPDHCVVVFEKLYLEDVFLCWRFIRIEK
ncbi:hypothetical protein D770_20305 [Flammeovirgaceae bacterium 311]|nr:hypothetical protein D770_20305 [Flammeovirgaceae bacterium 311]